MDYEAIIRAEAARQGVPGDIAVAVARRESGMRQYDASGALIVGSSGEIGMFQLKPGTAREVGVNPYDVQGNIRGGVAYLRKQFDRFGNWQQALQAYNGGARHVIEGSVTEAAWGYARAVLAAVGLIEQAPATGGAPEPWTPGGGLVIPWGSPASSPASSSTATVAGVRPEQIAAGVALAAGLYLVATSL